MPKRCKECRVKNRNIEKKKQKNMSENNNQNTYNDRDIRNNNGIEFNQNTKQIKKENSDNKNILKTLIASFAVIIGLAGGWFGYNNIINDNDQNLSPIQDETDIDSSVASSQDNDVKNENISAVQNNKLNSSNLSEQENIDSDKDKNRAVCYRFRNSKDLKDHFKKHGAEFGYENKEQYLEGANKVINSSDALHKLEKEDNDDVYYLESSNEFVIVSVNGYIRTYFKPNDGIEYYNRQ